MAKRVYKKPDWLKAGNVVDIYSVSDCMSDNFSDYIDYWKHNGYWFFDSPEIIVLLARDNSIDLSGTKLFYYEVYELEFNETDRTWQEFEPEPSFGTNVAIPDEKYIEGYDVVTFSAGTGPECSPLSCNSPATEIKSNKHCLLDSFEEAEHHLENGNFENSEPGPYRIFAVFSLVRPEY